MQVSVEQYTISKMNSYSSFVIYVRHTMFGDRYITYDSGIRMINIYSPDPRYIMIRVQWSIYKQNMTILNNDISYYMIYIILYHIIFSPLQQ